MISGAPAISALIAVAVSGIAAIAIAPHRGRNRAIAIDRTPMAIISRNISLGISASIAPLAVFTVVAAAPVIRTIVIWTTFSPLIPGTGVGVHGSPNKCEYDNGDSSNNFFHNFR